MTILMRRCKGCQQDLPLQTHYYTGGMRHGKQRYQYRCKSCLKSKKNSENAANPTKNKFYSSRYYYANKEKCLANMKKYQKKHHRRLVEMDRRRLYTKKGLVAPKKKYSFYRDTVKTTMLFGSSLDQTLLWTKLLSLPLTDRQRELVNLTKIGYTQHQIATMTGRRRQNVITKMWNGMARYSNGVIISIHGGIAAKYFKKFGKP